MTLPLPAMVQTIRHGLKPGISVGLVSLPVSLIAGSLGGLMFAIPVSAAGVIMGFTTEERAGPSDCCSSRYIYGFVRPAAYHQRSVSWIKLNRDGQSSI
ncbi:DUF2232 domain-containing protein [Bacillus licheniformis]|nr:DUF2232 domain-containing protein [Bacillus licheniformis]